MEKTFHGLPNPKQQRCQSNILLIIIYKFPIRKSRILTKYDKNVMLFLFYDKNEYPPLCIPRLPPYGILIAFSVRKGGAILSLRGGPPYPHRPSDFEKELP